MPRPKTLWRVARVALLAVYEGATNVDAAKRAGISPRTLDPSGSVKRSCWGSNATNPTR